MPSQIPGGLLYVNIWYLLNPCLRLQRGATEPIWVLNFFISAPLCTSDHILRHSNQPQAYNIALVLIQALVR